MTDKIDLDKNVRSKCDLLFDTIKLNAKETEVERFYWLCALHHLLITGYASLGWNFEQFSQCMDGLKKEYRDIFMEKE